MPPILRRFQKSNPNIEIRLLEETLEGVVDLLDDGKADMAFTYSDVVGPTHIFDPLVEVPPYALVARDNPLARQNDVSLADLADYPMVLFDLQRTKGYYLRFMTDAGHKVRISHRTESVEMVRTLVANGFGFSILNARPPEYLEGKSNYRTMPIREKLRPREYASL